MSTDRPSSRFPFLAAALATFLLAGCAVGPDYHAPAADAPPSFQESAPWKVAEPRDQLPKSDWWKIFGDATLDALEQQAIQANPDLRAALAQVDQARAVARISRAALLPGLDVNPSGDRERYSANRELPPGSSQTAYTTNSFDLPLVLNYEVDLFGGARRQLQAARATAQAQAAAYQNVLLSLQAELAQDYWALRGLARQHQFLAETVAGRSQELDLVRTRQQGGANDLLDVYRAEAELTSAESAEIAAVQQMAALRHALAVLTGRPPEGFTLDVAPLDTEPPAIPIGLPSELLERRPDVAQAERDMAAASAGIGVAKAAFFPQIGLTVAGGYNSTAVSTLCVSGSREWAIAPFVSVPVFQPASWANYQRSKFAFDQAAAVYRGRVLAAFQDVEDSLSGLRYLATQDTVTDEGVIASRKAADLSLLRYKQGVTDYFEVIDAERTMLDNQLQSAQLQASRFVTTVLLVKALGGGWH